MKLTLAIAFAAIAFAQEQKPAPFTEIEKAAMESKLQQMDALAKQMVSIKKQYDDLAVVVQRYLDSMYASRSARKEDWVPKNDLSDWVKPAPVAPAVPVAPK